MFRIGRQHAGTLALAGCSGAIDLLAITALSGTFVSVITGNLVIFGYGLGQPDPSRLIAVGIAVPAFALGVLLWFGLWRSRPTAVRGPLLAEFSLVAVLAVVLLAVDVHPNDAVARILLGVAGVAMGAQSVIANRLKISTTYMTGNLTNALTDLLTGRRAQAIPAFLQLVALLAGAAVAAALYVHLRWAAPLLPLLLLATAIGLIRAPAPAPAPV